VISLLECSIKGTDITLTPTPTSLLAGLHDGATSITEHTTCSYGLNLSVAHVASAAGMSVCGIDDLNEVRAIERSEHQFFLATLYQPQLKSSSTKPHPVFLGLVKAAAETAAR